MLNAGIYNIEWLAIIDTDAWRQLPTLAVFRDKDTIGTDTPLAIIPTRNIRYASDNNEVYGNALIRILADNTAIKFAFTSQSGADRFSVDAGSKLIIEQIGVKGEKGEAGAPGPAGPVGTDATITTGTFIPRVITILYNRQVDLYWGNDGEGGSFITITENTGYWMRIGDIVWFTLECRFSPTLDLTQAAAYFDLPQGRTCQFGRGVGAPLNAEDLWFAVQVQTGDRSSYIDRSGSVAGEWVEGPIQNAIRISVARPGNTRVRFNNRVSAMGTYVIVT